MGGGKSEAWQWVAMVTDNKQLPSIPLIFSSSYVCFDWLHVVTPKTVLYMFVLQMFINHTVQVNNSV